MHAARLPLLALSLVAVALHVDAQEGIPSARAPTHEWGCEVLLCLANPAGPTAVAACVPPIHRLWRELAKGHAFPSCAEATGPRGRSYAQPVYSYYDPCPDGSIELAGMALAELVTPMSTPMPSTRSGAPSSFRAAALGALYMGITGSDGWMSGGDSAERAPRVCVANHVDDRVDWSGDSGRTIGQYETIWLQPASMSSRAIDVYIDDRFWERVRY
jgi:hypothetical protein